MTALRTLALAAAVVAGILIGDATLAPLGVWLAAGVAGAGALGFAAIIHRRFTPPLPGEVLPSLAPRAAALLLLGALAISAAGMGLRGAALRRALLPALDGEVATVVGRVTSDPAPSGRATRFLLRAVRVDGSKVHELLSVRTFGPRPRARHGDLVRVEAKIRKLDLADPWDRRIYRKKIVAEATVDPKKIRVLEGSGNPLIISADFLRDRMNDLAAATLDRRDAGLVLGLTIGDDRLIPDVIQEDFRTTSLSHLTAVSGANVAMVLAAVALLLRAFRVSRRSQILVGLFTIGFFAVVTRGEPSVLRASVMASLVLAAFLFGRRNDPLHGLVFAFVALVVFDPFLLWSIGFQLSFAATLGILLITPRVLDRLRGLPRPVAEALALGIGAQIAVAPLLALHFRAVSLAGVPANLAAFGLVAPITVLGFGAGLLGTIWLPLGRAPMEIAGAFAVALRKIAHFFASIPGASVSTPDLGAAQLVAIYLLVAGAVMFFFVRRGIARYPVTMAVVVWGLAGLAPAGGSSPPAGMRVTFLDVGQGDAALVESRSGARVLVDGGPDPAGLISDLRRRGIGRLDLVAASHAHFDHINGLSEVLESLQVRTIMEPGVPDPAMLGVLAGRTAEAPAHGDRFLIGDLTIGVLAPDPALRQIAIDGAMLPDDPGEGSALNNASLVLRVAWGGSCILFTGDIEEPAQDRLVETHRDQISCAVLKAPHHGSALIEEEFVSAVRPQIVVISVGPNDYGHPSRTALSMFDRAGARILRTDRMEDVTLEFDEAGRVVVK